MRFHVALSTMAALALCRAAAAAQPDPAALDPAVDTSAAEHAAAAKPAATAKEPTPAPSAARKAPAARESKPTPPAAAGGKGKAHDRVDLETTQITGNRELPRVMYVVPWKRSDAGDLSGKPANSLLDEVLTPVDRDVFLRQNRYYDALKPDVGPSGASAPTN